MPATVWKGHISFGLVSFPVRLYSGARAEAVHFHLLHKKDLSRIKEVWYCADEDKPVDRDDIVKGFEVTKGHYIVVEEDELKKVAPPTASTMDVLQFVGTEDVDPVYFERSYYVGPESGNAKAFSLFVAALRETGQDAIAKVAMHNREHVVLLRVADGRLVLHTLYYRDELNEKNKPEAPDVKYSEKELELAKDLVKRLTAPFKPADFADAYRENVERMIEEKSKGQKVTAAARPHEPPVLDLIEALKRSLESGGSSRKSTDKPRRRGTPTKRMKHRARVA